MIVVKAGGGEGLDMEAVCADVGHLVEDGEQVVLVHGGSFETNVISFAIVDFDIVIRNEFLDSIDISSINNFLVKTTNQCLVFLKRHSISVLFITC